MCIRDRYGKEDFVTKSIDCGVDGLIIVDLPPEEDDELYNYSEKQGLSFIRLITPTTTKDRLVRILKKATGFVYYVSITGITGAAQANADVVAPEVKRIKNETELPVIVGFGVKTPDSAFKVSQVADGTVVGSAIIDKIAKGKSVKQVLAFVKTLADGVHNA